MASRAAATKSNPSEDPEMVEVQEVSQSSRDIITIIDSLKKQVAADRGISIKKRMEENRQKLIGITNHVYNLSKERRNNLMTDTDKNIDLLTKRQADALGKLNGLDVNNGEKDNDCFQEDSPASSSVLLGASFASKSAIRPIKLPEVKRLPPYTTWVFLDRNQRMTEDQSVLGRRRIYYDQNGGEALICSDSEEELAEEEEEKKEFGDVEDYILRMTIQEVGLSDAVLDSLSECLSRKPCDIKARYEILLKREKDVQCSKERDCENHTNTEDSFFDKDLDAALDSFDNLFCRRCLVFDCRLHGCSQDLVFPAEKKPAWSYSDEEKVPCGINCYRLALKHSNTAHASSPIPDGFEGKPIDSSVSAGIRTSPRKKISGSSIGKRQKSNQSESASSNGRNMLEDSESEIKPTGDSPSVNQSPTTPKTKLVGKCGVRKRNSKRVAERVLICMRKRQKQMDTSHSDSVVDACLRPRDMKLRSNSCKENEDASSSSQQKVNSPVTRKSRGKGSPVPASQKLSSAKALDGPSRDGEDAPTTISEDVLSKGEFVDENIYKHELVSDKYWNAIEKSLFAKGVEIFGRTSCLIARNVMIGMKTCAEVFQYLSFTENKLSSGSGDGANSLVEGHSKDAKPRRSRFLRRRGRVRRLKYTWKSAGYHSIRKRISERKDQPCRQFNPCSCQSACGKECTCLLNGTCCEKYCGCPKSCKNRFRGCHCAKSQCRSRQCPCFAADRECDPDVCRNCWVGCGDGTLGVPSQRGDNYECRNMKLLLKQQQRVLLGRSDVSGWGAFLKNSVGKHEYLGEYTGELISHREADKRGKIYDRENSSFLFNLNDQFVLDAYRKGDKLKFANHSPDPNCYAKVIMVAGDHRVGIFAKERINSGDEIFYDYRYEPDRAPAWARKPEAAGFKKEESAPSSGRAKKLA
ncbi:histone-lysine N-methyltransferase CLF-like isoform X2 [Macadamia integrifolia]|uniref:histone-lysine N-methyltransferase CLF-like isoform X2 n=1 Tax=Macadamia integrifolia TaxID=60698 RepID=UPI001C4E8BEE|nr:histone-lysine N-methyltransferase CLF-like isoform X2 [Macadamia integrifolia]